MGKEEFLLTDGGSANLYSHYGSQFGSDSVLLLGISLKIAYHRDIFTSVLIAARTWKQPKYPSTHDWTMKI